MFYKVGYVGAYIRWQRLGLVAYSCNLLLGGVRGEVHESPLSVRAIKLK